MLLLMLFMVYCSYSVYSSLLLVWSGCYCQPLRQVEAEDAIVQYHPSSAPMNEDARGPVGTFLCWLWVKTGGTTGLIVLVILCCCLKLHKRPIWSHQYFWVQYLYNFEPHCTIEDVLQQSAVGMIISAGMCCGDVMLWLRHLWIRLLVRCCERCENSREWMRFYRLGSCLAATNQQLWQVGMGELFVLMSVSRAKLAWVLGWELTVQHLMESESCCQGCSAFWSNMDGTVQKLAQMKDPSLLDSSSDYSVAQLWQLRNCTSKIQRIPPGPSILTGFLHLHPGVLGSGGILDLPGAHWMLGELRQQQQTLEGQPLGGFRAAIATSQLWQRIRQLPRVLGRKEFSTIIHPEAIIHVYHIMYYIYFTLNMKWISYHISYNLQHIISNL